MARQTTETELGVEAQCARCKEFWPADNEFFYMSKGRPHSWCKACYLADEKTQQKKQRWIDKQRAARAAGSEACP